MNKNVIAVCAAVCGLFMVSCDTPKDNRPSAKASVDYVQPGTRHTYNVSDAGKGEQAMNQQSPATEQHVMPNHDQGANTIQPGDSLREGAETNTGAGAIRR